MLPFTTVVLALGLPQYQGSNVAVQEVFDAAGVCSFFSDTSGCALKGDTFSRSDRQPLFFSHGATQLFIADDSTRSDVGIRSAHQPGNTAPST